MKKIVSKTLREWARAASSGLLRSGLHGLAFSLALLFAAPLAVHADNPGNNTDTIKIRIIPVVDLGVVIDTAAVNLNFTMGMGATDYTVTPATITILGNITPQEVDIVGTNSGPASVWTLDDDEVAEIDELQLYALFSVGRSTRPTEADFAGDKNLIKSTTKRAGQTGGAAANQNFENNNMLGGADMDGIGLGEQRQLWLRIDTPPLTSTGAEQDISVTITATRTNM